MDKTMIKNGEGNLININIDLTDELFRLLKKYRSMTFKEFCDAAGITEIIKEDGRLIIYTVGEGFFFEGKIIEGNFADQKDILKELKREYIEMKMIYFLQSKIREVCKNTLQ